MSGARARTNVVPMPTAAPPAPQGQMMPAPMMWSGGGMPAGCCPPGGMDALLQCYCDIQAATAFISKVVTDLAQTDPAFQQALVDAIAASGSNIPLIGVTNGADAQPGQVGEWIDYGLAVSYTAATQSQPVTMGTLPPGDWDIWASCNLEPGNTGGSFILNPIPAGFTAIGLQTIGAAAVTGQNISVVSAVERALTSVPSLINFTLTTNMGGSGSAGAAGIYFTARRRR